MTKLGKLFVFVQFILSIGALVAAVVSYTFHIRSRAKNENYFQPEIKKHADHIRSLAEARDRAEARWAHASGELIIIEGFRPKAKAFYDAKYNMAVTGKDGQGQDIPNPVQALEFQQSDPMNLETRTLVFRPIGPTPLEYRSAKVLSYNATQEALKSKHKLVQAQQAAIATELEKYAALSVRLNGDNQNIKGLYRERLLMEVAGKRAIDEQVGLKPPLANRYSEAVLVLKRQNALLERKQELEKIGVAAGNRP